MVDIIRDATRAAQAEENQNETLEANAINAVEADFEVEKYDETRNHHRNR